MYFYVHVFPDFRRRFSMHLSGTCTALSLLNDCPAPTLAYDCGYRKYHAFKRFTSLSVPPAPNFHLTSFHALAVFEGLETRLIEGLGTRLKFHTDAGSSLVPRLPGTRNVHAGWYLFSGYHPVRFETVLIKYS